MTPELHGEALTRDWSPGRAPWEDRERMRAREAMRHAIAVATAAVDEPATTRCTAPFPVHGCSLTRPHSHDETSTDEPVREDFAPRYQFGGGPG